MAGIMRAPVATVAPGSWQLWVQEHQPWWGPSQCTALGARELAPVGPFLVPHHECKRASPGGDEAHGEAGSCRHDIASPGGNKLCKGPRGLRRERTGPCGYPSQFLAHRDRGCNGGSAPCASLNSGALLLWQSGFHPQAFSVAVFLSAILTANSSPLPSLLSKPQVPAPSPHPHRWTHVSGWARQGCGMDCLYNSHSVLPATDQFLHSPPIAPEAPLLSQLISPPVRGLLQMQEPLFSFSTPHPSVLV